MAAGVELAAAGPTYARFDDEEAQQRAVSPEQPQLNEGLVEPLVQQGPRRLGFLRRVGRGLQDPEFQRAAERVAAIWLMSSLAGWGMGLTGGPSLARGEAVGIVPIVGMAAFLMLMNRIQEPEHIVGQSLAQIGSIACYTCLVFLVLGETLQHHAK